MKILYSQSTQAIRPYPRADDDDVAGLDADYLVLNVVDTAAPAYDSETQRATYTYVVDTELLEYRKTWTVTDIPPPAPVADWVAFNLALFGDADFIAYSLTANQTNAITMPALVSQYTDVPKLGIEETGFSTYWEIFCQQLQVTAAHRETWAGYAELYNLPADFVDLIREGE